MSDLERPGPDDDDEAIEGDELRPDDERPVDDAGMVDARHVVDGDRPVQQTGPGRTPPPPD